MGRYVDDIAAAEENAALSEEEMARRVADMEAEWGRKAGPLKALLTRLSELQTDLAARNVSLELTDNTDYPVPNQWNPSVEFHLVKPNAFPPRTSARFRVKCSSDGYRITTEQTSSGDEGRKEDLDLNPLDELEIDQLIRQAIRSYPWWMQEPR